MADRQPSTEAAIDEFARYVSPSKVRLYQQIGFTVMPGRREGVREWDLEGKRSWIDCRSAGGVFNLGHRPPRIIAALKQALDELDLGDHMLMSRWRAALAKRLASLGISVVTQPGFIYFNGDRYLSTVSGEQLKHLYPIGTLMRNGAEVAGSSDCPIAPANPLIGICSAVTRMSETNKVVSPEEGISPLEALRMYTDYAARASFEEATKGSITVGKLADLVILNNDLTRVPADEIKDLKVEMTILNGEVVWDRLTHRE